MICLYQIGDIITALWLDERQGLIDTEKEERGVKENTF